MTQLKPNGTAINNIVTLTNPVVVLYLLHLDRIITQFFYALLCPFSPKPRLVTPHLQVQQSIFTIGRLCQPHQIILK